MDKKGILADLMLEDEKGSGTVDYTIKNTTTSGSAMPQCDIVLSPSKKMRESYIMLFSFVAHACLHKQLSLIL